MTQCATDRANCDGNPANGCEVDLTSDSNNCHACGHSCGGGACSASKCQAVTVASSPGPINSMVLSGSDLYWTATTSSGAYPIPPSGVVMKHSIPSGGDTTLANGQDLVNDVQSNGGSVYWTTNTYPDDAGNVFGRLMTVGSGGGTPSEVASSTKGIRGATLGGAGVYWYTSYGSPTIYLSSGTLIAATSSVGTLAADSSNVYWTNPTTSQIMRGSVGSAFPILNASSTPGSIVSDGSFVYWTDANSIGRVTTSGNSPVALYPSQGSPAGLIRDGSDLYWVNTSTSTLMRNGNPITTGVTPMLAVDGSYVYYANGSQIFRISKSP